MGTPGGHPGRPPAALDVKLGEERQRAALVTEAWRLVTEGLDTGTLTLKSGKTVVLDAKDQLRLIQFLASMTKRTPQAMPLPKDLFLKPTG